MAPPASDTAEEGWAHLAVTHRGFQTRVGGWVWFQTRDHRCEPSLPETAKLQNFFLSRGDAKADSLQRQEWVVAADQTHEQREDEREGWSRQRVLRFCLVCLLPRGELVEEEERSI